MECLMSVSMLLLDYSVCILFKDSLYFFITSPYRNNVYKSFFNQSDISFEANSC